MACEPKKGRSRRHSSKRLWTDTKGEKMKVVDHDKTTTHACKEKKGEGGSVQSLKEEKAESGSLL